MSTIGNSTIAVTLTAKHPHVTVAGHIDGFGSAGAYTVAYLGERHAYPLYAAVFGPAGENYRLLNAGTIDCDNATAHQAGIVLGSPGNITNRGLIIGASGIDIFGSGPSTILNDGVIQATIATGIYAQSGGLANNAGTITAATRGIVVNDHGEAYNTGLILAGTPGDDIRPVGIAALNASVADNAGTLTSAGYGIVLTNGAHAYNTGTISCYVFAIYENQPTSEYVYAVNSGVITCSDTYGAAIIFGTRGGVQNTGIVSAGQGIVLSGGGAVRQYGQIDARQQGILLSYGGLVQNAGTIIADDTGEALSQGSDFNLEAGIALTDGGTVINAGYVTAALAFYSSYKPVTLTNTGVLASSGAPGLSYGVEVYGGGSLSNGATGVISGGILAGYAPLSITNAGTITSENTAIRLADGGTVFDSGTIAGTTAIAFAASRADRLILTPAAAILGAVNGGGGALELAAETKTTGTITLGTAFTDFATLQIDQKSTWDLAGILTAAATLSIVNDGTISESQTDHLTIDGPITGSGLIALSHFVLTVNGSVAAGEKIKFSGTAETLALGDPHNFLAKIESFTLSDTIDLTNVPRSAITGHQFAHGVLTLDETAGSLTLTFASPSGFKSDAFALARHGAGTTIKLEPSASQTSRAHPGMAFPLPPYQTIQLPLITLQP